MNNITGNVIIIGRKQVTVVFKQNNIDLFKSFAFTFTSECSELGKDLGFLILYDTRKKLSHF